MVEEKKTLLGKIFSFLGKYTGISLVLGGILSVWKNLFGGKGAGKEGAVTPEGKTPTKYANIEAGQEQGYAEPEMDANIAPAAEKVSAAATPEGNGKGPENGSRPVKPQPKMSKKPEEVKKEKVIHGRIEILRNENGKEQLVLKLPGYMTPPLRSEYNNPKKTEEYLMFVKTFDGNVYQITGIKKYFDIRLKTGSFYPITSLKRQGVEGDVFYELDEMKSMLGFDGSKESIAITEMYKVPVAPEVSIPKSAPATEKVSAAVKPEGNGMGAVSQAKFSSDENSLLLVITKECYKDLKDHYQSKDNQEEFCAFVQCDGENLCITGSYEPQKDVSDGKKAISVTSVKNEKASGEKYVKKALSAMKTKVGLDDNRRFVEITKMSPEPFKPVVSSFKPAVPKLSNGNQEEFIGSIKVVVGELKLVVPKSHASFIEQNSNLLYVQCGSNVCRITCNSQHYMSDENDENSEGFSINSVAMKDGTSVSSKLEEMRDKLGLNKTTEAKVTIMSTKQAAEVSSPTNGDQPSPSFTNPDPKRAPGSGPTKPQAL